MNYTQFFASCKTDKNNNSFNPCHDQLSDTVSPQKFSDPLPSCRPYPFQDKIMRRIHPTYHTSRSIIIRFKINLVPASRASNLHHPPPYNKNKPWDPHHHHHSKSCCNFFPKSLPECTRFCARIPVATYPACFQCCQIKVAQYEMRIPGKNF